VLKKVWQAHIFEQAHSCDVWVDSTYWLIELFTWLAYIQWTVQTKWTTARACTRTHTTRTHTHKLTMSWSCHVLSSNWDCPNVFVPVSFTQAYFEQWLRMMLLWEPKGRGQKSLSLPQTDSQRPYCFEFLDQILLTKVCIIHFFLTHVSATFYWITDPLLLLLLLLLQ